MKVVVYSGKIPSNTFISRLEKGLAERKVNVILHGFITRKICSDGYITVLGYKTKLSKLKIAVQYFFKLITRPRELINLFKLVFKERTVSAKINKWIKFAPIIYEKPDIFHLQWVSNIDYWIDLQDFGIKIICSLRGRLINSLPLIDRELVQKYESLLPRVDGFHAVSNAIASKTINLGAHAHKIKVVYSGMDFEELRFKEPTRWPSSNDVPISIISIGHPGWKKAFHYSLLAMNRLKSANIKFNYEVIGGISEELFYLRSDLGLDENVTFTQNLTFEKIKFGVGASLASFLFFFLIGYMAKYFSKYANNEKIWKYINYSIITFMSILVLYIFFSII